MIKTEDRRLLISCCWSVCIVYYHAKDTSYNCCIPSLCTHAALYEHSSNTVV